MRRFARRCSKACAVHPLTRLIAKVGVNSDTSRRIDRRLRSPSVHRRGSARAAASESVKGALRRLLRVQVRHVVRRGDGERSGRAPESRFCPRCGQPCSRAAVWLTIDALCGRTKRRLDWTCHRTVRDRPVDSPSREVRRRASRRGHLNRFVRVLVLPSRSTLSGPIPTGSASDWGDGR
jgi:hypothetical protein